MIELVRSPTNSTPLWRFRFGTAEFDEAQFELRVAGATVELQRKPLEMLRLLLTRAGEVVTKDELLATIWDGRPTVENVIANAMTKLRTALGEDNSNRIVTQPRIGYRFVGAVQRIAVGQSLGSRIALNTGDEVPHRPNFQLQTLLGASPHNEVWLARHLKTKELRVYKFATGAERLSGLKREATLARFVQETLGARADFVRVLDWNFETAPFFLECEYGGDSLLEWSRRGDRLAALTQAQRLELFLQIADAVAAAHDIGVLHKDIKPANVLIAPQADGWQVRLTDFGSGRLLDPERLSELGITRMGLTVTTAIGDTEATGTLLYLAPELIARQPPTVKSDLYALGMLLYQLSVRDLRKPMVSGWQRDIDNELLCEDIGVATDGDPHHRLNSVAELSARLRRLDERALERDRHLETQRQSALLEDTVRRSRMRRPWLIATIATLMLGIVAGSLFYYRLHLSESALARQHDIIQRLNAFLADDFIGAADPDATGRSDVTVIEAAHAAAKRIDLEFGPTAVEIRAVLHGAMQSAFVEFAAHADAIDEGRKALRDNQQLSPRNARKLALTKLKLVTSLTLGSGYREAATLLDEMENDNAYAQDTELLARIHISRAVLLDSTAAWSEAIVEIDKVRKLTAHESALLPQESLDEAELTRAHANRRLGHLEEGEAVLRNLLASQSARDHPKLFPLLQTKINLAELLVVEHKDDEAMLKLTEALATLRSVLGPGDRRLLRVRGDIASLQYNQGKFADAAETWGDLFRSSSKLGESAQAATVVYETNFGMTLLRLGATVEAEGILRDTLSRARAFMDETSPRVQAIRYGLAACLLDMKRPGEASQLLKDIQSDVINRYFNLRDGESWLKYQKGRIKLQNDKPRDALNLFQEALLPLEGREPDADIDGRELEPMLRKAIREAQLALNTQ